MSKLPSSTNSENIQFNEDKTYFEGEETNEYDKPKTSPFSIQLPTKTQNLVEKLPFFEKAFRAYNIASLVMSSLSFLGAIFGLIFTDLATEEDDKIYTIGFTVYNFVNFVTPVVSIQNNNKFRSYRAHVWILRILWGSMLLGTAVNVELLENFPLSLHNYFGICVLLVMVYLGLLMFIVTRGQKLLNKMTGTEYLNR